MLTNLTAETGNPVVAAIHFRVQSNRMRVNRIASVYEYSRAGDRFTEQATNLRYIKSRKALESSTTAATPNWAEVVQKAQERGVTVLTESDVVKLYGPRLSFISKRVHLLGKTHVFSRCPTRQMAAGKISRYSRDFSFL